MNRFLSLSLTCLPRIARAADFDAIEEYELWDSMSEGLHYARPSRRDTEIVR